MAMEHGFSPREAPSSIFIKLGQVKKKEAHVCIFDYNYKPVGNKTNEKHVFSTFKPNY